MSDEQKITDVRPTPKGEAYVAAMKAQRGYAGESPEHMMAGAMASAVDAYVRAQHEAHGIVERVTLLEPKPGDVVVLQLRESATLEQISELAKTMVDTLPSSCDQVHFVGARCIEGVQVVRPERQASRSGGRRLFQYFHEQVMNTAKEGGATDGN